VSLVNHRGWNGVPSSTKTNHEAGGTSEIQLADEIPRNWVIGLNVDKSAALGHGQPPGLELVNSQRPLDDAGPGHLLLLVVLMAGLGPDARYGDEVAEG
jgi:hypothetical protein